MSEPTIPELLDELVTAVEDYSRTVGKLQEYLTLEVAALWSDRAALRDEVHESVTALSNRIEAVHR